MQQSVEKSVFVGAVKTLRQIITQASEYKELCLEEQITIRLSNKTFWERLGRVQGALSVLLSIGFEVSPAVGDDDYCITLMDPRKIDAEMLGQLLSCLDAAAAAGEEEGSVRRRPLPGAAAAEAAAAGAAARDVLNEKKKPLQFPGRSSFDPFKSFSVSTNPDAVINRTAGRSTNLQAKLDKLSTLKSEFLAQPIQDRCLVVYSKKAHENQKQEALRKQQVDSNSIIEGSKNQLENSADGVPSAILAEMRAQSARPKPELKTRLQRALDELQDEVLYPFVLVRVEFPDGMELQGRFKADETTQDVEDVVRHVIGACLLPALAGPRQRGRGRGADGGGPVGDDAQQEIVVGEGEQELSVKKAWSTADLIKAAAEAGGCGPLCPHHSSSSSCMVPQDAYKSDFPGKIRVSELLQQQ